MVGVGVGVGVAVVVVVVVAIGATVAVTVAVGVAVTVAVGVVAAVTVAVGVVVGGAWEVSQLDALRIRVDQIELRQIETTKLLHRLINGERQPRGVEVGSRCQICDAYPRKPRRRCTLCERLVCEGCRGPTRPYTCMECV